MTEQTLNRRDFLKQGMTGLVAGVGCSLLGVDGASARETVGYSVAIRNDHTGEVFSGVYRVGGYYVPKAFRQINFVMRDHYSGDMHPIDPRLIDIVARLQKECNCSMPINILSGYRSPNTNAMLRGKSRNVAQNSFHIKGQAADIRIPGTSASEVQYMAKQLRAGGVGYYPHVGFVHVDTGDIRTWVA